MLEAITESFFGNCLTRVEPDLIKYTAEFHEEAWMLIDRYPKPLAKRVLENRSRILAAMDRYTQILEDD